MSIRFERMLAAAALIVLLIPCAWAADGSPPPRSEAEKHLRTAREAAERRDFAKAREHLTRCLQLGLVRADVHLLAARTARRAGDYASAEKHLAACRRLGGPAEDVRLEESMLRAQRGELSAVEKTLLAAVKKDHRDSVLILEALTRAYMDWYRLTAARACLEQWLQHRPDDTQALMWRGWVNEHWTEKKGKEWTTLQEGPPSLKEYRRVLQIDPQHDEARQRLAEGLIRLGQPTEALEQLERLRKRRPKDAAVRLGLARCRILLGQAEEGVELLDGLLADQPNNAPALVERGRLSLQEGENAIAEKWLRRARAVAPADYQANYLLLLCLERSGKSDEAKKIHARLDQILSDKKRLLDIWMKFDRQPNDPSLCCEAGIILLRNDREKEGVRWLLNALRLDPRNRPTHQALASYYTRKGDKERAAWHQQMATHK